MYNIYLDTETTDIIPGQICELTMILEDATDNKYVNSYNYFFTVDSMTEGAQNAHGFSLEQLNKLSQGVRFSDKYQEILDILNGNTIIAHNEVFDEKFISTELWRCGISFTPANRYCTMKAFKDILKIPSRYKKYGPYKNPKVSEVIEFLNIIPDKISEYSKKLFNYDGSTYHDSRFDTTAIYIAVNVYREKLHGGSSWQSMFCMST